MKRIIFLTLLLVIQVHASNNHFEVVALGVKGGFDDANLSSWLVKPINSQHYVSLDSGTLIHGLKKAFGASYNEVLTHQIPDYLISHAHFDHYMGMVMAQPELRQHQTIMAQQKTMDVLLDHVFNWSVWGNFGDLGEEPRLSQIHYQSLPLKTWIPLPGTDMQVKAFPLSHGNGYPSTAFLIQHEAFYLLYFGDTGADRVEKSQAMQTIWTEVAPLIRNQQLKAIFLECSFNDSKPISQLFGHLTPGLYMEELEHLAKTVAPNHPESALQNLTIVVTHIKPEAGNEDSSIVIMRELQQKNHLNLNLVLPVQGNHYYF